MTDNNKTHLTILLDRSGSMSSAWNDTIGGLQTFIDDQKKIPGEMEVTIAVFDSVYEVPYRNVNLKDIASINNLPSPRGSTALYDSFHRAVVESGEYFSRLQESQRPGKVLFVVVTDGGENSSKEITHERVKEVLKEQTDKYQWNFIFLGANFDANSLGQGLGLRADASANYTKGTERATMSALSQSVRSYRGKFAASMDVDDYSIMKTGIEGQQS